MTRNRLSTWMVACTTGILLTGQQTAHAQGPQMEEITFALLVQANGFEEGLGDYLSDDTTAVLFRDPRDTATTTFTFAEDSPPCDGADVAGTSWLYYANAKVLNHGGNHVDATIILPPGSSAPPIHSVVLPRNVVDIQGCWLKENGSGGLYVQEGLETPDGNTAYAIFIVTAEFRVSE